MDSDPDNTLSELVVTKIQPDGGVQEDILVGMPQQVDGSYGTLTIDRQGQYTYSLNNNHSAVNALSDGDPPLTDLFHYTIEDPNQAGATAALTVFIQGTNDAPEVDLDGNNNTTNGDPDAGIFDYVGSFMESGTAVRISDDMDTIITDAETDDLQKATITLSWRKSDGRLAGRSVRNIATGDHSSGHRDSNHAHRYCHDRRLRRCDRTDSFHRYQ